MLLTLQKTFWGLTGGTLHYCMRFQKNTTDPVGPILDIRRKSVTSMVGNVTNVSIMLPKTRNLLFNVLFCTANSALFPLPPSLRNRPILQRSPIIFCLKETSEPLVVRDIIETQDWASIFFHKAAFLLSPSILCYNATSCVSPFLANSQFSACTLALTPRRPSILHKTVDLPRHSILLHTSPFLTPFQWFANAN